MPASACQALTGECESAAIGAEAVEERDRAALHSEQLAHRCRTATEELRCRQSAALDEPLRLRDNVPYLLELRGKCGIGREVHNDVR